MAVPWFTNSASTDSGVMRRTPVGFLRNLLFLLPDMSPCQGGAEGDAFEFLKFLLKLKKLKGVPSAPLCLSLAIEGTTGPAPYTFTYEAGMGIVASMKGGFNGLFGVEKDHGFESAIAAFSDGNKRIAAAVFVYFLGANGILYRPDGTKRLADNALVALTLLIAESKPDEKETIVKVVINLINRSNDCNVPR